jgi:hypothetical protein
MAGFLESLGAGLRHGGLSLAGGMSKEVFREQGRNIETRKQDDRNRRDKTAEIMLKAAATGQIPDERLPDIQQAMAKLGYDIPLEALGPSPQARELLDQYARGKTDRAKLEAANVSMENLYDQPQPGLGVGAGLGPPGATAGLRGGGPEPIPLARPGDRGMEPIGLARPGDAGMAPIGLTPPGVQTMPLAEVEQPEGVPVLGDDAAPPVWKARDSKDNETNIDLRHRMMSAGIPADQTDAMLNNYEAEQIYSWLDDVAKPPGQQEMQPDYPAITMKEGEIGQMPSVDVLGRRPKPVAQAAPVASVGAAGPQEPMVPGPVPGGGNVPASLMSKWKEIVRAKNAGSKVADDVFKQLLAEMYPTKKDLISVPEGGTILNPTTGKVVFQGAPKTKTHVIDGALVDDAGNVIYKGTPEQLKVVQEFNAMLDAAGITDPTERQTKWAEYASRKGAGVTVNTGQPKAPTGFRYKEDGTTLEQIKGGPADELDAKQKAIVIGTQNTKDAIKEYRTKLNAMSTLDYAFPNKRAKLQTSYSAMLLLAKEAFNLGVLNPNDRVIMEEIIRNPLDLTSNVLTKETLDEQAATLDKMMDIMERNASQVRPQDAQATPSAPAASKQRKSFKGVEYEEIGAGRWRKVKK